MPPSAPPGYQERKGLHSPACGAVGVLLGGGWTLAGDWGLVDMEGVPMHIDRNAAARGRERAGPGLDKVLPRHIWRRDGQWRPGRAG